MKNRLKLESSMDSNFKTMIFAIALLLLMIIIGVLGYIVIENFKFYEALYMTVITMSTVGFKEVHELSQAGMIFTSILIVLSFGVFATVITTATKYIVSGVFSSYFKIRKVKKQIERIENHVIVVGFGRIGKQVAEDLIAHNQSVVIIEQNLSIVEKIRNTTNLLFVHGDATNDEALVEAGIMRAKALISALKIDADNLFVVLSAREMNNNLKIISRASNENSDKKLKHAGADNVIMPAKTGGTRMAKLVAQPDIVEFLDFVLVQDTGSVRLEEVSCYSLSETNDVKTIRELDIRNISGANIVGLRRADGSYIINPTPDETISKNDKIFALGFTEDLKKLKEILR
ncbi:MAG TPA: potassium channel protein [Bacteroidales bacterium]|mgnify:FL=1|nr:potassium channel protein [Bacteroidales bacterium]HXK80888.1 potassium channel protein [Bacteroidales bacterium]